MPHAEPQWINAARSYGTGACVELSAGDAGVTLRNSRQPGLQIDYTHHEFEVFVQAVKNGEFDHLLLPEAS